MPIDWDSLLADLAFGIILGVVIIIGMWIYRFGWSDMRRSIRRRNRDRTGFTYSDTGPTWGGDGGDGGGGD